MLMIYVPQLTNRIGYTLKVLFHHILHADYEITTNAEIFESQEGAKLCYGSRPVGDGLFLRSCGLLTQTSIEPQETKCFLYNGTGAIFPTYNAHSVLPFDVLAASFYCLTRYEEYLPHRTDRHGRFTAAESVAYRGGFLHLPIVDIWARLLAAKIGERYPEAHFAPRHFEYEDTFDIDAAYCYKHKGLFRTLSGTVKDLHTRKGHDTLRQRVRVLTRREQDPFDTFDYILEEHQRLPGIELKFFPLMADYNVNDKSINYLCNEFRELLKHLNDYATMGIHASYASYDDPALLAREIERLERVLHSPISRNRYHFLRFTLPNSYEELIYNNISHDYSMGYAEEPGFRAGTGTPYPFFNLENNCEAQLTIHPFAVMDSTLFFYKKMSVEQAWEVYRQTLEATHAAGGTFSALWHNPTLSDTLGWEGWRDLYRRVLERASELRRGDTDAEHQEQTV